MNNWVAEDEYYVERHHVAINDHCPHTAMHPREQEEDIQGLKYRAYDQDGSNLSWLQNNESILSAFRKGG